MQGCNYCTEQTWRWWRGQIENAGKADPADQNWGQRSAFSTYDDGQVENADQVGQLAIIYPRSYAKYGKKNIGQLTQYSHCFRPDRGGQVENDDEADPADTSAVSVFDLTVVARSKTQTAGKSFELF